MSKPKKQVSTKAALKISDLLPDEKNANRGTKRGAEMLGKSLTEYGAGRSILIDKQGRVIAGNKTLASAKAAGLKDLLVVQTDGKKLIAVQRMDLDLRKDRRAKELAIADNRAGELNLEWDEDVLKSLSSEINLSDFFNEAELCKLIGQEFGEAPEPQMDRAAELQQKWGTARGQIWEIGRHRLMCGDCSEGESVTAELLFTDPPFGIAYKTMRPLSEIKNDGSMQEAEVVLDAALRKVTVFAAYICCDWRSMGMVYGVMSDNGMEPKSCIVWDKKRGVQNLDRFAKRYELILYSGPFGGEKTVDSDVWEEARDYTLAHPTIKPVSLISKAITYASNVGDRVFDPFSGSGSTMAAAQLTGRACEACEIEPKYVAVALERLSDMGLKPKLT